MTNKQTEVNIDRLWLILENEKDYLDEQDITILDSISRRQ